MLLVIIYDNSVIEPYKNRDLGLVKSKRPKALSVVTTTSYLVDSITPEVKRDLFWSILFDNITPKNNRELFRSLLSDKITLC